MKKASKALIYKNKEYLLQLRDDKPNIPYPNCWSFFGGGIDNNETPWKALQRELQEELNWIPKKGQFLNKIFDTKSNCFNYLFAVPFEDDKKVLILGEGKAKEWFTLEEIKNNNNLSPNIMNHMISFVLKDLHNIRKHKNN